MGFCPARAHDALLLARPISARILGEDPTPTNDPDFVNDDALFRVRFRVISVLAGEYRQREVQLDMRAHLSGMITSIPEWSILLTDAPDGQHFEAYPVARMVCVTPDGQRSGFLQNYHWVDPVGHGLSGTPLGNVVCAVLQRYSNELN